MKRIGALIIGLLLISVSTLPAGAGTLTTNKFLYKPSLGAKGQTEKNTFDAGLDRVDVRLAKEIWVGDPNYGSTLQEAVTAIAGNQAILRIPKGAHAITAPLVIPANIALQFEDGAYLDLTGLPVADIEGMSCANPCVVTWTGHGLSTGDIVTFSGITQYKEGTPPTWQSTGQWMFLNFIPYTITKINDNSFSIAANTSTYDAYVPATDPGKVNACIVVKSEIKAQKSKIINYSGNQAPVYFHPTYSPQRDLYPEWFGALGDQVTDDLQAFNQAIGAAKLMSRGIIHLSRKYKLSDTLSVNDINSQRIVIRGSERKQTGIISYADGYPALETVGSLSCIFEDFTIIGNKSTSTPPTSNIPSVAIAWGRSKAWGTGADHIFRNIYIDGYYQYGEILSIKGSSAVFNHVQSYTGIPNAPYNNRKFCVGLMGENLYSIPARNTVFSTWTAGVCDMNTFIDCQFMGASAPSIPADCAAYLLYQAPYTNFHNVYTQGVTNASADMFVLKDGGSLSAYFCPIESTHRYTFNFTSTNPTSYSADVTAIDVRGSAAPTAIIKTDANTILKRCCFLGGSYNSKIDLGGGAVNCTFQNFNALTSFSSGGVFIGNRVELPDSTTNFDLSTATNVRNNLITDLRAIAGIGGCQTLIDGDLRVGQPSFVTPNNLTVNAYRMTWAAAAPSTGSWAQGSVVWNTGAASGGAPGWVCTANGSFGTLNGGATTGTITSGTKILTVNSVTGLKIGDFIDVAADGGGLAINCVRVVNIDTTNKIVTLVGNAAADATNQAVSFHNDPVFKAMANLL